jgi:hypothetical protein
MISFLNASGHSRHRSNPIDEAQRASMTLDDYKQLPPEEQEHFAKCDKCGEIFDRRSLDEALFHQTEHKHRPDIQYGGSEKLH